AGRSDEPRVRTTFQANRAGNGARSSGCQLLRPEGTSETRTTGDARERRTYVQSSLRILRVQIGGLRGDRGRGLDYIELRRRAAMHSAVMSARIGKIDQIDRVGALLNPPARPYLEGQQRRPL